MTLALKVALNPNTTNQPTDQDRQKIISESKNGIWKFVFFFK